MVNLTDIILGITGFGLSFYGGAFDDLFLVVSGVLILILTIYLKIESQESDIQILNAQINTKSELDKIWRRLDNLENDTIKKRK